MMLRLILVGLVTSMGLELPSGRDVSSWAESGRAWVDARLSDLPVTVVEVDPVVGSDAPDPAPGPDAAGIPTVADLALMAASDVMAAEFASDRPVTIAAIPASADPEAVGPDAGMPTVGLPDGEELMTVASPSVADASVIDAEAEAEAEAVAVDEVTAEADDVDAPSSADRLGSAVRMTREAAHAWATLILEIADEAGPAR